jgi:hypothetical protein
MSQNNKDLIYTLVEAINNAEYRLVCYEIQLHKTWFDEECSKLGDQNEANQFSPTQHQRQISGDNLNNVRFKKHWTFQEQKYEKLSDKTNTYKYVKKWCISDLY